MENFIDSVKYPSLLSITGEEGLSIGESISLFFGEFGASIDKKLGAMGKSVHLVDVSGLAVDLKQRNVLYVKNTGVEILTPEGYTPGVGSMDNYIKNTSRAVYLSSSLKTEASRLYDWIKQIIRVGRIDKSFAWTVTDFSRIVEEAETFIKELPEERRKKTYSIGQVYVNFEDFFEVVHKYNTVVKTFKPREVELTAREITRVYDIGMLLVKKIKENDITLTQQSLDDLNYVVTSFTKLTNITGALLVLLNETQAVLTSQAETFKNLK